MVRELHMGIKPTKTNGWSVHFSAVEVEALGYCTSTIRSCSMSSSLTRKLVRSSVKTLL